MHYITRQLKFVQLHRTVYILLSACWVTQHKLLFFSPEHKEKKRGNFVVTKSRRVQMLIRVISEMLYISWSQALHMIVMSHWMLEHVLINLRINSVPNTKHLVLLRLLHWLLIHYLHFNPSHDSWNFNRRFYFYGNSCELLWKTKITP